MTLEDSPSLAEFRAQNIHEHLQARDTKHDRCPCWCCCTTCDFNYWDTIAGPGLAATLTTVDNEGEREC